MPLTNILNVLLAPKCALSFRVLALGKPASLSHPLLGLTLFSWLYLLTHVQEGALLVSPVGVDESWEPGNF